MGGGGRQHGIGGAAFTYPRAGRLRGRVQGERCRRAGEGKRTHLPAPEAEPQRVAVVSLEGAPLRLVARFERAPVVTDRVAAPYAPAGGRESRAAPVSAKLPGGEREGDEHGAGGRARREGVGGAGASGGMPRDSQSTTTS